MPRFDFDETFGDDYLPFYLSLLTDERNQADAEVVTRLLALRAGDRVLDAPCGHGRIANQLAAGGCDVVGVDITGRFLDLARADDPSIDYRHGDLRALPVGDAEFDAALSWFTSFGYFDDDENKQVLREYARALRPGGRLLVEVLNRDNIIRRYTSAPFGYVTHVGDDVMIDQSEFDPITGRIGTDRTVSRGGRVTRSHHSVRLLAITEWVDWLHAAGFEDVQAVDHDGQPVTMASTRLVVLATRSR
jgi:SAM-dependent methyltransferase